ncbi:MAG TPA: response regulator [Chthoniobacterales bacterium]|nr:response regulator [Chthoniobacterales bacterium]
MKLSRVEPRLSPDGSRPRVLCVDDNDLILGTLKAAFKADGFEVETAYNGFNALGKLTKNPHALQALITDLRMPGVDGFGLIEKSRAAGYAGPIVVYAASITGDARQRLVELGIKHVIEKPARSSELIAAVRESLSGA